MVASLDQVIEAALALPESERAELVDTLISTFAPEDAAPLNDAWLAEINRRSDEFDAGGMQTLTWAEVKERARQRRTPHGEQFVA
jgi:putative addiction module component (TIGR02574 family)